MPCPGVVEWTVTRSCSDSDLWPGWPGLGPGLPVSISVNVGIGTHFWGHMMTVGAEPCAGPLSTWHGEALK